MNQSFDVNVDSENEFVHKIIVSGELRRGTKLSGIESSGYFLIAKAKRFAKASKCITLGLIMAALLFVPLVDLLICTTVPITSDMPPVSQ